MIRVGFDYRIFFWQRFGGISRYFAELTSEITSSETDIDARIIAPMYRNHYVRNFPKTRVIGFHAPFVAKENKDGVIRYSWIGASINEYVSRCAFRLWKPDVVHETYYAFRPVSQAGCRTVLTVYDMITELRPDDFAFSSSVTKDKEAALKRATHIICISECTRNQLIEYFGVPREKTTVIYLGGSLPESGESIPKEKNDEGRKFLLYVGNRDGYKNFKTLIKAYATSKILVDELVLVAFGGGKFTSEELDTARGLNIGKNKLLHIEGGDQELRGLYSQAEALVFPSICEGFGLPLVEAMEYGCPVLCSDTSVMPEICGTAADYFDPENYESVREAIERLVSDPSRRKQRIIEGHRQAEKYSWGKCAKQTAALYRDLYNRD
ncbi:glycosyltransferase family 4 protein [Gammaproteobacteria bacterium]|nr:glycosyltransferase family 4 protein [Gammaproteobacteria bacterium]